MSGVYPRLDRPGPWGEIPGKEKSRLPMRPAPAVCVGGWAILDSNQ